MANILVHVVKPFSPLVLVARVNAQLRRALVFSGSIALSGKDVYEINGLELRAEVCRSDAGRSSRIGGSGLGVASA